MTLVYKPRGHRDCTRLVVWRLFNDGFWYLEQITSRV